MAYSLKEILVLFVIFGCCLCNVEQDFRISNDATDSYMIVGAGPNGLYLAERLLSKSGGKVTLFESRDFTRTQCVRLPFDNAKNIPIIVRNRLWPDEKTRNLLFSPKYSTDDEFWPRPTYAFNPVICIDNFQTIYKEYLEETYPIRFTFIRKLVSSKEVLYNKNYSAIFVTTGNSSLNTEVRKGLSVDSFHNNFDTISELEKRAIYVIYNTTFYDDFIRNGKYISRLELSSKGLTYSPANNGPLESQIYTYPKSNFIKLYEEMPESLKNPLKFPKYVTFKDKTGVKEHDDWLTKFKEEVVNNLAVYNVSLPESSKLHYADRFEYFYENVAALNFDGKTVFFVGDSMGATDFMYGLNLGRGMLSSDEIVSNLLVNKNILHTAKLYQDSWNFILKTELQQNNPNLVNEPNIFWKYVVSGRTVDGEELNHNHYEKFYKDYCKEGQCSKK